MSGDQVTQHEAVEVSVLSTTLPESVKVSTSLNATNTTSEDQSRGKESSTRLPKIDLPMKRRRKFGRPERPRRDNRKSRFDADYIGDDDRHNADFEAYYRKQGIVPESEFATLMASLATPLPSSFRITTESSFRDSILHTLRTEMTDLFMRVALTESTIREEAPLKPLSPLPWYPDSLAWTVSAPRQMLRRDNVLSPFHKFLVRMNEIGAVNRQEAVSMIPPLLLDVRSGHSVIDLCAAPGSKTAQILEAVSARRKMLSSAGVVIANDSDLKRCWMLAHQLKRFGSAELVVTHHEAQHFPKFMTFDRVLCDVPCSGDGTLRKAPDIWRRWNSDMGIALHRLQRQIVDRGVDILKPGGRLVYSTCSLNPMENEAIVAHVLRKYGEDIELLDCSDMLPGLVRRPGLRTWAVKDNSGKEAVNEHLAKSDTNGEMVDESAECNDMIKKRGWFSSFDEVPLRRRIRIVKSLFPPSETELDSRRFNLERCMRLVPHDQDTGAFFVAVFHKRLTARMSRRQRREEKTGKEVSNGLKDSTNENEPTVEKELEKTEPINDAVEMQVEHDMENKKLSNEKDDGYEENSIMSSRKDSNFMKNHRTDREQSSECVGTGLENVEKESNNRNKNVIKKPELKTEKGHQRGATKLITDDPLVEVRSISPETVKNITDFFGLDKHIGDHYLMTRGSDGQTFKKIVAVSRTARTVLRHGIGSGDKAVTEGRQVVRVVNAGVRVLERTDRRDTKCGFRLIHDGIGTMRQMMSKRVMVLDARKADIVRLLKDKSIRVLPREMPVNAENNVGEEGKCGEADIQSNSEAEKIAKEKTGCEELWKRVVAMGSGSAVLVCDGEELVVWVGKRVVDVVMTPDVIDALRIRFESG